MTLLDLIHRTAFLGGEFLTWLWYRSDQQGGVFHLGGEIGEIELWFDDRLVVSSLSVDAMENLFKGGHPTSSAEAMAALKKGKKASEAKLRAIKGAKEWSFILSPNSPARTTTVDILRSQKPESVHLKMNGNSWFVLFALFCFVALIFIDSVDSLQEIPCLPLAT